MKSKHPLYGLYSAMKYRCYNPKATNYKNYGGRGIIVCDRWLNSFDDFLIDIGEKPTKWHSIDRINNDGNYEPSNCKWSTRNEQNLNKRYPKIEKKGSAHLGNKTLTNEQLLAERKAFVLKLSEIRKRKGYTLEQLSKMTGIPLTSICKIEKGHWNPGIDLCFRIAFCLNKKVGLI